MSPKLQLVITRLLIDRSWEILSFVDNNFFVISIEPQHRDVADEGKAKTSPEMAMVRLAATSPVEGRNGT
jgi:hypothetical protein